jgi:hypothetical protein
MKGMKTPGSGRKAGTPNKTTAELRELAQAYGPESIEFFVAVRDDPAWPIDVRIMAADKLLDRGYGKASQAISVQVQAPPSPAYFDWLPADRLEILTAWLAEARDAMERGDPQPAALLPGDVDAMDAVLIGSDRDDPAGEGQG